MKTRTNLKGIIIYDPLNAEVWYDNEKVSLSPGTAETYIKTNITHSRSFKILSHARKYAFSLSKKLKKPIFDKGTRKTYDNRM